MKLRSNDPYEWIWWAKPLVWTCGETAALLEFLWYRIEVFALLLMNVVTLVLLVLHILDVI